MEIADPGLPSDEPSRRERLMLAVSPALALTAPLLEAYGTLSIPLFAWPSALLAGSLAAIGVLLGALIACLMSRDPGWSVRDVAFCCVLTAGVMLVVDVSGGGHALLTTLAPGSRMTRLAVVLLAGSGLMGAIWLVRRRIAGALFVACLAFFGSTVTMNVGIFTAASEAAPPPQALPPAGTSAPPVVYLVFDEAMGIEGLQIAPGGRELASQLRDLLVRHRFRVHGGAFSRHFVTSRSIPNVLNFEFRDDDWGVPAHANRKFESRLFRDLAAKGYQVISYGTAHIDFCFSQAARCEVLPSFNPFSPYVENSRVRAKTLFQVVWEAFTESYFMYRYGKFLISIVGEGLSTDFTGVDTYAWRLWFDRFESDLLAGPRGRAYFGHFLMPHAPYVFDDACRETGRATVGYMLGEKHGLTGAALDSTRASVYQDYVAQYRCLTGRLEQWLERLDRDPRFADATIVIQGDHGPRISAGQFAESVSARDLVDNYSALYAIRSPDVVPGYDTRVTSIQRLTAEYFGAEPLGPDYPTIAIDSRQEGQVRVLPMPVPAEIAREDSTAPAVAVADDTTR